MFNGQVGDAAPCIEPVRRDDGLGRADVDAGAAAATGTVAAGQTGAGRQRDVDIDFTQKKHRTRVPVQHQRVLAAPALAAARGQLGLQHRCRIGEHAVAERAYALGDLIGQFLQAPAQHLVVVAAPGVEGNHGLARTLQALEFDGLPVGLGSAWQVVQRGRDHRQRAGHQLGRSGAAQAVRRHIGHLAMKTLGQPGQQPRLRVTQVNRTDADLGQSQRSSASPNERNQLRGVDSAAVHALPIVEICPYR